ncbi:ABC transporter ATP-binding protein [Thermoplasmatales archaeon SW_10_69_26]|nr:MAG: ABC transporter ATP-binding protein [Thermoplasmatales archaeon SW_10_69_26]
MSTDTVLEARDLHKDFGGVNAVDGASFELDAGEFVGLIGPNGAGKTTMFNLLAGSLDPTSGTVMYREDDVTAWSANKRARAGLVRTFQIPRPFRRLTVRENTMVAGPDHPGEGFVHGLFITPRSRNREIELQEKAHEILDFVGLDDKHDTLAGHLSGGQRKLLEIGRALMLDPEVLLLDEPMAGVNPTLGEQIIDRLKELHERGMTLCVVEHDMDFVLAHCPRAIVMVQGQVLVDGPPSEVLEDPRVLEAYLGGGQAPTERGGDASA